MISARIEANILNCGNTGEEHPSGGARDAGKWQHLARAQGKQQNDQIKRSGERHVVQWGYSIRATAWPPERDKTRKVG